MAPEIDVKMRKRGVEIITTSNSDAIHGVKKHKICTVVNHTNKAKF